MKDTVMVLRNLKKDVLTMQIPQSLEENSVRYVRDRVIAEIEKTIRRKDAD